MGEDRLELLGSSRCDRDRLEPETVRPHCAMSEARPRGSTDTDLGKRYRTPSTPHAHTSGPDPRPEPTSIHDRHHKPRPTQAALEERRNHPRSTLLRAPPNAKRDNNYNERQHGPAQHEPSARPPAVYKRASYGDSSPAKSTQTRNRRVLTRGTHLLKPLPRGQPTTRASHAADPTRLSTPSQHAGSGWPILGFDDQTFPRFECEAELHMPDVEGRSQPSSA
jgi:hypothetical protein